ncbi:TPA: hypothetical protein I9063_002419 [Clostridium perfringens]|uniref:Uncharacterized protein n=1 Tax=Clostridium perfringens TaxID=1502 RepID=A0AAN5NCK2_CLOPF|nr:hypothetical protein [Clostridium perfringens]MDM0535496.1 hypothetical protein [Clostridium perfringens]HAT4267782.1 hypothetical protein [Clostridium perfringens]HAT4299034.1 hypothetical protein [Clostridium perfringens]
MKEKVLNIKFWENLSLVSGIVLIVFAVIDIIMNTTLVEKGMITTISLSTTIAFLSSLVMISFKLGSKNSRKIEILVTSLLTAGLIVFFLVKILEFFR